MVDFDRLIREDSRPAPIEPGGLFRSLVSADRFSYLRDVQQDVLRDWYDRRSSRDTIIKMSTGAGKTVVGLLMLQSGLNEGVAPALYLCPTVQLVEQVVQDAADLGVAFRSITGRGEVPVEFDNGECILVTTFQKLFNAKSVFGVHGGARPPVAVGALLVDDAHSCLKIAREQTTVTFGSDSDVYRQLFSLFENALSQQSETKTAEIREGYPWTVLPVPFWAWQAAITDVARILTRHREGDELKFAWNLMKDELMTCHCFITGQKVEIGPHLTPIRSLPTFVNAQRRIFLSATLADDSILPREFDVKGEAVEETIRPRSRGDIGERMILVPDLVEPGLGEQLPRLLAAKTSKVNAVVLVPSAQAAAPWREAGAAVAIGEEVVSVIDTLRSSTGNFVVLVNRYDGIDLPDNACRILVIDGLPRGESLFDQHLAAVRQDSLLAATRLAQTVEQGFGRGVRSGKDRCVVLVTGRELVRFISTKRNLSLFSPETRAQIELGRQASQLAAGENVPGTERLLGLMRQCLKGDEGWRKFHASRMASVGEDPLDKLRLRLGVAEREAVNAFYAGDHQRAVEAMRDVVNALGDDRPTDAGWYLQTGASFLHAADPTAAQQMQKRAHELNPSLLRPMTGVRYRRIALKSGPQAERVLSWAKKHAEPNAVVVSVGDLLSRLAFGVESERFEEAWRELGDILGFRAQRPEREFGKGPDGLWAMPGQEYLLAEAKSSVRDERQQVYQSETEQLSNSVNWFRNEYGSDVGLIPVLIHPTSVLAESAYPPEGAVVLERAGMSRLHRGLSGFAAALAGRSLDSWSSAQVGQLLADHELTPTLLPSAFCRSFERSG